ncbi:MAG: PilW family protein [Pseudomonadota bacterium]
MIRQSGFSLLELLVALAVTGILLGGLAGLLLDTRTALRLQGAEARIQENLRFAMATLERDLAAAGHLGCGGTGSLETMDSTLPGASAYHDFTTAVSGIEAVGTGPGDSAELADPPWGRRPALPPELRGRSIAGSDLLLVRRARAGPRPLSRAKDAGRIHLHPGHVTPSGCGDDPRRDGLCPGDFAVLSDCRRARTFRVSDLEILPGSTGEELVLTHDDGNAPARWGHAADPDWTVAPGVAVVQPVSAVAYYVATEVDGEPALYRRQDDRAEALVRGVDNLQVLFVVREAGGVRLVTAAEADFRHVVAVRVGLLLRSERPLTGTGEPEREFVLGGASPEHGVTLKAETDRRLRRAVTRTFALPNGAREAP